MDSFIIKGPSKISGCVEISGSKNSALPIIFSTILTEQKCEIKNVPQLSDIKSSFDILSYIGKNCFYSLNTFISDEKHRLKTEAPYDMVRKMRASVLVSGPLLARFGHVKFAMPGGCAIGVRPIDIHLDAFKKMGANIEFEQGYVILKAKKLKPTSLSLKFPSVGATENLMMAAAITNGCTIINNAAKEPEIVDLARVLNLMGAKIEGAGTDRVKINGCKKLKGFNYKVMSDRIEAGTFLILCAACGGELEVKNINPEIISILIEKLKESGAELVIEKDCIKIKSPKKIKPVSISTGPYPEFPTDLQAQWMAYMCLAKGSSNIIETIFENRFMHAAELMRMGADIKIKHNKAIINGVDKLIGAPVMASDLRAGAALLIGASAAFGESIVKRIYHIDRGYEKIEEKMRAIGVNIKRIKE